MRQELLACGLAEDGQLGLRLSDSTYLAIPEHIVGGPSGAYGSTVKSVACGEKHTLLLAENGQVWCVGSNEYGQLGRGSQNSGSYTIYPVSITVGAKAIQIAAGRYHSLAVFEDGRLYSWGSNEHGQLGLGSGSHICASPKRVAQLTEVVQVAAGQDQCIALTENGTVWVWGQQGDGLIYYSPVVITSLQAAPIVRVCAGGRHYLALTSSGTVFSWGANDYGQLGLGDLKPHNKPEVIESVVSMKVCELAAGYSHSLLLTKDGTLFAFGSDSFGQLGLGRRTERQSVPVAVTELMGSSIVRIACGRCHSAVVIDGKLYPFGLNTSGQLGNGSTTNKVTPCQTDSLRNVSKLFAGWDQMFLIRSSEDLSCVPGPSAPVQEPRFLSHQLIMEYISKGEKVNLIGELESAFSSISALNGSFLYSDERRFPAREGYVHSGVDLDAVMESFNAIAESRDSSSYTELLKQWMKECMKTGEQSAIYNCAESIRIFLILPWLNFLTENVKMDVVLDSIIPFAGLYLNLSDSYKMLLKKWWTKLPARNFNRIVTVLISGVRCMVLINKTPDLCIKMLLVLEELFELNRANKILRYESFYITELADKVDIRIDYINWISSKNSGNGQVFWVQFPFLLNGVAKADLIHVDCLIQQKIMVDQVNLIYQGPLRLYFRQPFATINVRRDHIVYDTMLWMSRQSELNEFRKPLKIQFVGEEGEDAGGIKKEFFILLFQQILDFLSYGMFVEDTDSHLVWFSGYDIQENMNFQLLGVLFGMAVYNDVLVPFPFPLALYKMILNQPTTLEDLTELSPVEGRSLQQLLDYEGDDFEEVFCLNFTITLNTLSSIATVPLKTNGENLTVTQDNKQEYVRLYVRYRLEIGANSKIEEQVAAFREGFGQLLNIRLLLLFQPNELMEAVIGNENYDWTEFRNCVTYKNELNPQHPVVLAFWKAFFKLTLDERKMFMRFLMGSPRLPVRGLEGITIIIQPCAEHLLPVAHTCANLLEIPKITDADEMYRRLLLSIQHTEGFTLV
ncbi:unnamed protein product [Auanema sp. JU1783]|nr:unnamed protein product [Auanema sp. JU1783]